MDEPASMAKSEAATQTGDDGNRGDCVKLGEGSRGLRGVVVSVGIGGAADTFDTEVERRLLEIGLVEGARVEILHEGFIGRDPIAVRVDDMRVALRRREANAVLVRIEATANGAAVSSSAAGKEPG